MVGQVCLIAKGRMRGITRILFLFNHIWVFALRMPSSSDLPGALLNLPITEWVTFHRNLLRRTASHQEQPIQYYSA